MNKKGFNFAEILISTAALSILMLGFSQFTADIFNVSANHAAGIKTVNDARFTTERIITQISKAAYIYPAGISINLSEASTINTSNSVAMLVPDSGTNYFFVAYYGAVNQLGKSDLYEFVSNKSYNWSKNICPAAGMKNFSGKSSIIAENINPDGMVLDYALNYENPAYDSVLRGEISGADQNNENALIKGIDWKISQGTSRLQLIEIKGISNNAPRFFE